MSLFQRKNVNIFGFKKKLDFQTYSEFVHDLTIGFNHRSTSSNVTTVEDLCNLVVLEQFKNSVPEAVATFLYESKVTSPSEAAALADEYVLTHKPYSEHNVVDHHI